MRDCPIAIVGLGGVFPGARDVESFWSNIASGRTFSRPAPAGRWVVDPARVPVGYGLDSVASVYGCFVDDDFSLDASGLGLEIDASIFARLDPVYSMAVHAGAQAFRDARMGNVDRGRVGVILAAIALPTVGASAMTREVLGERFRRRLFERFGIASAGAFERRVDALNARATALPGALVAEALGLGGGSYTLDAACASSLYAVKLACDELRLGRCDAMIAGGVSRPDCLYTQMGFTQLRALSPSGVCAPFDASSDGLVVGEGAGAVVLKRLDDARRDGDAIHGVIRGIGLSNDIGGSLLAPDSEGQLRAMRAAYAAAGWRPRDVELVECHGTGTPLGDAVEVRSLRSLWEGDDAGNRRCAIGSIKSMIGHLLTGAGAAGLIKTLLAIRHGMLPPSANYRDCGDVIPLAGSAFFVPTEASEWRARGADGLRRAAVSAFGFGGINAHVLIEESRDAATVKGVRVVELPATGETCVASEMQEGIPAGVGARKDSRTSESRVGAREESRTSESRVMEPASLEPVAIVGMDARVGAAEGLDAFRDVVFAGASAFRQRSAERWRGAEALIGDALRGLDVGAYLDRIDVATGEFKIPPNEIAEILPQQLVMMKSVAAAMRDATLTAKEPHPRWGVVVGMALDPETTNFHLRWWLRQVAPEWAAQLGLSLDANEMAAWTDRLIASIQAPLNAPGVVGNLGGMIASRVAREFRFGGPSFGVSCEEASGLRALEIGARSLQLGETDVCVVGAVDLAGDWRLALAHGDARIGEGAASVVLKRLSDAERDGNRVYALVRGAGTATCGGVLAGPRDGRAVAAATRRALRDAGVAAGSIGYVEMGGLRGADVHVSSHRRAPTPEGVGHPAHADLEGRHGSRQPADAGAFFAGRDSCGSHCETGSSHQRHADLKGRHGTRHCSQSSGTPVVTVGSAVSNFGHCGAAAGLVSLVRAALVVHERMLPAVADRGLASLLAGDAADIVGRSSVESGSTESSVQDGVSGLRVNVPRAPMYWHQDRAAGPRRAGVSAVTSDGNAAHVVLEEYVGATDGLRDEVASPIGLPMPLVFACSGGDAARLIASLESLRAIVVRGRDAGDSIEEVLCASLDAGLHVATDALCVSLVAESVDELVSRIALATEHLRFRADVRLEGRDGVWYSPAPLGLHGDSHRRAPSPEGVGHLAGRDSRGDGYEKGFSYQLEKGFSYRRTLGGEHPVARGHDEQPAGAGALGGSDSYGREDDGDTAGMSRSIIANPPLKGRATPVDVVGTAHPTRGREGTTDGLAFVFPGSGNHFIGMGRAVAAQWPQVVRRLDAEFEHLASHSMVEWFAPYRHDWSDGWELDAAARACADMRRVIFGQVAYGMLMHDVLCDMGLRPGSVIGYSLGESTSLFATRAWPDADEMWRRMSASSLFKSDLYAERDALKRAWQLDDAQAASWRTVIFAKPAEEVRKALEGVAHARLMIVNAPRECVVGGLPEALAVVGERLKCRAVQVESVPTVHFDAVRVVQDAYRALHLMETRPDPSVRYYSCHLGRSYEVTQAAAAESITAQALDGFDFAKLIEQAYADGVRCFVEVGPQGSCTRMIRRILGDRPHFVMSAGAAPGESEVAAVMRLAAACLAERLPVALSKLQNVKMSKSQNDGVVDAPSSGRRVVSVQVGGVAAELDGLEAFVGKRGEIDESYRREPNAEGVGHLAGALGGEHPVARDAEEQPADAGALSGRDSREEGGRDGKPTVAWDMPTLGVGMAPGGDGYEKGFSYQRDPTLERVGHPTVGHLEDSETMPEHARVMLEAAGATAAAHEAFMRFAEAGRAGLVRATQIQMELVEEALRRGELPGDGAHGVTSAPWHAASRDSSALLTEQWHPGVNPNASASAEPDMLAFEGKHGTPLQDGIPAGVGARWESRTSDQSGINNMPTLGVGMAPGDIKGYPESYHRAPTPEGVGHPGVNPNVSASAESDMLAFEGKHGTLLQEGIPAGVGARWESRTSDGMPTLGVGMAPEQSIIENPPMFPRELCMEFAVGKLGNVLGGQFAGVDAYPVRVRLPAEPLMLVDRILTVEAEIASLSHGRVVTEHDVLPGAWYLDGGVAPVCITVEAGQADLFLCSYLGIDLAVKGTRAYRLLDATVEFHSELPRVGETIRYDIHIDRFVKQGETYLFFFRFDGTIGDRLVLTMRNGCAGFFTNEEIAKSGGIILTAEDTKPTPGRRDPSWRELVPFDRVESYSDEQVAALRAGDLEGCFGALFAGLGLNDPLRLPGGRMKLFDRVLELDPNGGRFGLGRIRAEADIHPDDWFLTCHFVDDMTMPGTLMYECCVHALRFFLLRLGWVGEQAGVSYQPLLHIPSALKCRGPVTQVTRKVHYEVDIKEIGYGPEPYVIADALMLGDGRKIVQMLDMSLSLRGLSREGIENAWKRQDVEKSKRQNDGPVSRGGPSGIDRRDATLEGVGPPGETLKAETGSRRVGPAHRDEGGALDALGGHGPPYGGERIVYDKASILAYSNGRPSEAFGDPYRVFDSERVIARLPGPPFQFMDRVVEVNDEPFVLKPTDWITSEYDVPADAWYFSANRQPTMPFAVLLEAALQPCGWLAAYCGSALRSKTDVSFRNLGGTATLHREVHPRTGMLTVRVRMTNVNEAGGMIIQEYDMQVFDAQGCVYEGTTSFGFFSKAALAQQLGIRDAKGRRFAADAAALANAMAFEFEKRSPWTPDDAEGAVPAFEGLVQPARAFLMLDRIDAVSLVGGPAGLGFVRGSTPVDPDAWFFKAHFYQDPVWPGSLGLESFLQLLKAYAIERWGHLAATHRFEGIATGLEHTWAYRGQILPMNKHVEVEAVITRVEDGDEPLVVASGFLTVDGTTIYEMKGFGLRMVRA
ncbi:MAG: acyltransferase domain-containing protein [Phycisphaerales bacterium]|nr:acyltransferase domain-containing protein [Phycisphaerales bacterium]MCB9856239.1 acyltransferase domain-containing protein [Phycisphaerales bacterium]MCB9863322.1 acyltransferase domain-containing protein [Phycisphaerales bacterium]